MGFQAAPFDVVEASRRVWLEHWDPEAASGMAVFTAILRSHQLLSDQVNKVMRSLRPHVRRGTRCSRGWRRTRSPR